MKDKYLLFQYQLSPTRKKYHFAVINQLTRVGVAWVTGDGLYVTIYHFLSYSKICQYWYQIFP